MFIVQYYGSEVMPPYPGSCFDVLSEPHGDWIVYSRHTDIKKAAWRYHRLRERFPELEDYFRVIQLANGDLSQVSQRVLASYPPQGIEYAFYTTFVPIEAPKLVEKMSAEELEYLVKHDLLG